MSVEITYYPDASTRDQLEQHLLGLGFIKHPTDPSPFFIEFTWFKSEDYLSFAGVEANIITPEEECAPCGIALHTRTRAGASFADRECQNRVIREAKKKFGGYFYNDWYGKNRYTKLEPDSRDAPARGIYIAYETVTSDVRAVQHALPHPTEALEKLVGTDLEYLSTIDPIRVLYNALVPFAVAALEHFFGQCFRILLHYDPIAIKKLEQQSKKIEIPDAIALRDGTKSIEEIVADWYSFQSIASIHKAFHDWFEIDVWHVLRRRRKIGRRLPVLEEHLNKMIEFRHGVVHRFALDRTLRKDGINELLELVVVVIDTFMDALETKRGVSIRDISG